MKKNIVFMILAGVLLFLGGTFVVSAYMGDFTQKGLNYSEDRHELMVDAFENNDYEIWKNNHPNKNARVHSVITKDNFDRFSEMHKLMEDGNYDEVQKIREELGLGFGRGQHKDNARQNCAFR